MRHGGRSLPKNSGLSCQRRPGLQSSMEALSLFKMRWNCFFSCTDREEIVRATLRWIRTTTLVGYHGSRLVDCEIDSIRACGLLPLTAHDRRKRLIRALSCHPRWDEVAPRLDTTLEKYGPGDWAGVREGRVDLTLSRSGLVNGFNHYLTYGSEFDQHVAHDLLGDEGKDLLMRDGEARVIRVAVPGEVAVDRANRYYTVDEQVSRGRVPNLVNEFLLVWSYSLAHPTFACTTLKVDCGMAFHDPVSSDWIVGIDTLDEF